jgi:hypothetical protein
MPSGTYMLVFATSEGRLYNVFMNEVRMFARFFSETDVMPSRSTMLVIANSEGKNFYDSFLNVV